MIATSSLKASAGFTRLRPSILVVLGYGASFFFLSRCMQAGMGIGTAYAIWSGLGIILIASVGVVVFGEKVDTPALVGFALILAGAIVLNLFSKAVSHG